MRLKEDIFDDSLKKKKVAETIELSIFLFRIFKNSEIMSHILTEFLIIRISHVMLCDFIREANNESLLLR